MRFPVQLTAAFFYNTTRFNLSVKPCECEINGVNGTSEVKKPGFCAEKQDKTIVPVYFKICTTLL